MPDDPQAAPTPAAAAAAVRTILRFLGEDPDREGLRDTPDRLLDALREHTAGYAVDPDRLLAETFSELDGYDEMVLLRDVPFVSRCEHHLEPIVGRAHVGYLPVRRVVGIGKLAEIVEAYAKRLQIQERMTAQIADVIQRVLQPRGVGVVVQATHHCVTSRGIKKAGSSMVTSRLTGAFRDDPTTRREFLALIER